MPRRSGRYPWGSGENPYQSEKWYGAWVREMRAAGMTNAEIAKLEGISTKQLAARVSISNAEQRAAERAEAIRLKDKGYSNVAIGKKMGKNESSIRALLDPVLAERAEITMNIANLLKENVDKKKYLDVGTGTENHLGISRTRLDTAVEILKEQGYQVHFVKVPQLGVPGNFTSVKVLVPPGTEYKETYENRGKIQNIAGYSEDGGRSFLGLEPPKVIDSKRIKIVYSEEGGKEKDGVIELRRGVDELSLGQSRYAQVRIAVDGDRYMKGMAIYSDNMPDGIDILYNTNKPKGTHPDKVFKSMDPDMNHISVDRIRKQVEREGFTGKKANDEVLKRAKLGLIEGTVPPDPDNPFGSTVRQKHYIDKDGKEQLSALNMVGSPSIPGSGEEGSWSEWSRNLSSQFLSKQSPALAKRQLKLAYDLKKEEFDEINKLTNPVVKKKLLMALADEADSAAVHLKAAALPRQGNYVILPIPSLKDNEVYAPKFRNGEEVVLIRHPHGGKFEIPQLKVNNRHPEAKKILGTAVDAIGINSRVAERLSGADFDGDTVLVIPNSPKIGVRTSAPLKGLENFDPHEQYKGYEGMQVMSKGSIGRHMGDISNLITDMSVKGAPPNEIVRAVRHSMVVIDAHKHKLNYKQSYIDNGIASLKKKYQGSPTAGAATLISRASSDERVPHRREGQLVMDPDTGKTRRLYIDPSTGKKLYEPTGETYVDKKTGKTVQRLTKSTKMAEVEDARELSSGTTMENLYADHANKLKALGNQARKEALRTPNLEYSPSANKTYKKEVATLDAKLNNALKNAPRERQAQIIANHVVRMKLQDNPGMDKDDIKKVKNQALSEARIRTGASKDNIVITDKEWAAIQAGAISTSKLTKILNNTDIDVVKQLATPRTSTSITPAKKSRIKSMLNLGYTQAEIADAVGVSTSTITEIQKGG